MSATLTPQRVFHQPDTTDTYLISVTCPACGSDLEPKTSNLVDNRHAVAVAFCRACRRRLVIRVLLAWGDPHPRATWEHP